MIDIVTGGENVVVRTLDVTNIKSSCPEGHACIRGNPQGR